MRSFPARRDDRFGSYEYLRSALLVLQKRLTQLTGKVSRCEIIPAFTSVPQDPIGSSFPTLTHPEVPSAKSAVRAGGMRPKLIVCRAMCQPTWPAPPRTRSWRICRGRWRASPPARSQSSARRPCAATCLQSPTRQVGPITRVAQRATCAEPDAPHEVSRAGSEQLHRIMDPANIRSIDVVFGLCTGRAPRRPHCWQPSRALRRRSPTQQCTFPWRSSRTRRGSRMRAPSPCRCAALLPCAPRLTCGQGTFAVFRQTATLTAPEGTRLCDATFRFSVHAQDSGDLLAASITPAATPPGRADEHRSEPGDIFDMPRSQAPYIDVVAEGIAQSTFFSEETEAGAPDNDETDLFETEEPIGKQRISSVRFTSPSKAKRAVCMSAEVHRPDARSPLPKCRTWWVR